jgi:MGT family glycosyltransferase
MCSLGAGALHDLGGPVWATLGINPLTTLDPEIPMFGSGRPPAAGPSARLVNRLTHLMTRRIFMPPVTRMINAERRQLGLADLPPGVGLPDVQRSPYLHLMPTTPAFEYPRARFEPGTRFVGPLLPAPPTDFTPPPWWPELADHRIVHVTQGTYATDPDALIRPTVAALAEVDVLVVVTTPDPASLGALPANVRVAPFVPHARLLPHVDAMITNAGYNGVLTALAHGVPLVCAGRTEDKADVSARVAWAGAGVDLRSDTPTAEQVRRAVHAVLTEPSYHGGARRIRDDFARHDPPAEAAAEVLKVIGVPADHRFAPRGPLRTSTQIEDVDTG